ncbi:MAG: ATP-binding cassette domain-containing protein [Prevotella copri]|nr:ATP-binding cassette domain-containing protein [Segatella copri]
MIAVDGLTVEFGGTTLFKDISFQINEKDRIALMGKNGAGKSTLLKIIAGVRNATTNSWNRRRWKIFRNWRRSNNSLFYCFLIKKYFKHKTKSPDVSNKRNIRTLFFSIYSEKPFPKNSIRKNFLPDITKAPGAGS